MACRSDIDLATLHQNRLEERWHYGLAWCGAHGSSQQQQLTHYNELLIRQSGNQHRQRVSKSGSYYKVYDANNTSAAASRVKENAAKDHQNKALDRLDDDSSYFTSTTRRRRSGTWPRTRSLNAPSPFQQFGPCGRIMKNSAMVMQIQDPASQRLTWYKPPLTVLVIKKKDSQVLLPFVQLVEWLVQEKNMVVWVESAVLEDKLLRDDVKLEQESAKFRQVHEYYSGVRSRFLALREKLVTFKDGRDDLTDRIDFIVCLGGDGTLLYASQLFQQSVPPVMAFYLGSLGFLTPFQCDNFQDQVTNVLEGHAALTLRSRLRCSIHRKGERHWDSLQQVSNNLLKPSLRLHNYSAVDDPTFSNNNCSSYSGQSSANNSILVLNEVVINRGPSPYLSNIDIFLDGKYITSVQGDGLIVSTPTGSTAYAAAAGASMIHPSVPAILVTPICPHSLSFRPIVVPAGVELKISISPDSRNTSRVSFDGRNDQELNHGDSLRVTTSIYPVPSICAQDQISDWFDSLAEGLHWNVRKRQKCLDELSDLTASGSEDTLDEFDNLKIQDS
ncbi:NAD kinase-like isoform X4 [Drosophila novamexicana]|uniref:NAD kinase-like isoform X4 n=1 Tax=Drosophila novamexicana TaxID=47314 RepID=UPI0011E59D35|nr:NAD kinase-like isoform X4 [Drosophila novamexicana]XP_030563577.1 NAD kinase-like isoform X4 [Drosophila novamexicana]